MPVSDGVVTQRDAGDAGLGMVHHKDLREVLVLGLRVGGGQHLNGRSSRVGLVVVELVAELKVLRNTLKQGMLHAGDGDFELPVSVMAAGTAAGQLTVVGGPVGPVVPQARVQQHQSLAGRSMGCDGLAHRCIGKGLVGADEQDVRGRHSLDGHVL